MLTEFQKNCERHLNVALQKKRLQLINRRVEGVTEKFIVAGVSGSNLRVWIYENEAMIDSADDSFSYEAPDFETATELIEAFVGTVLSKASGARTARSETGKFVLFKGDKL